MAAIMAFSKGRLMMFAAVVFVFSALCSADSYNPHIIIVTTDDIGYNDVGFNHKGHGETYTPYLDELAKTSMVLENYYVMPNGHSTRSALLTAKHPAVLGTQFEMTDGTRPYGLDPSVKLLPEYLKELGYSCHAVGQWDLGFYSRDMLPTERGYDSFYGSYLSYGDYNSHEATDKEGHKGLDLHNNGDLNLFETDTFKPELYATRAVEIISDHDSSKSLHLYVALQSAQIHDIETLCKTEKGRGQIPNDYYRILPTVEDPVRKCYLALVAAADQAFGRIQNALNNKGILRNTILIFTTTSGGPAAGQDNFNAASNYPFRGAKLTGWEGGVRGVGLVYTDRIQDGIFTSDCMFHVTDWIPTLLTLSAHLKKISIIYTDAFSPMYGKDQYSCVFERGRSNRQTMIHFLYGNSASIQKHNYKYIVNTDKKMETIDEFIGGIGTNCGSGGLSCNPASQGCLFDLSQDPCERRNIADLHGNGPTIATFMSTIADFNKTVNYDDQSEPDERGDPELFDSSWQPWIDSVNGSIKPTSTLFLITAVLLLTKILS